MVWGPLVTKFPGVVLIPSLDYSLIKPIRTIKLISPSAGAYIDQHLLTSISIIFRNLTGQNPVSPGYLEMMDKIGLVADKKKKESTALGQVRIVEALSCD
jgi:hypothetical protein